jgi:hypothetical protein
VPLEEASEADLLVNLSYDACTHAMNRFRRAALVDIDPGLLQVWLGEGVVSLPPHDAYFSIGETVGQPGAPFPDAGIEWQYTPPCVALDWWPVHRAADDAPFTTVSHWQTESDWVTHGEESYRNDKHSSFHPFRELPRHTSESLELALCLAADAELRLEPDQEAERRALERLGWRVVHSQEVSLTPADYQRYIQRSRGEFSWAKPSCRRLQNAWISDRTLCYLASGKPAVVEHTGPSRFLPDAEGLFRVRDVEEAAQALASIAGDYKRQCRAARSLPEEWFDARKVTERVLERTLT